MEIDLVIVALVGSILRIAPAFAWAAIGDCITQRAGGFNIGIEGIVPCGAVAAIAATSSSSSTIAVLVAACVGFLLALIFALCCVLPRVSELVVGVAFLIGATALARFYGTSFLSEPIYQLPSIDLGKLMFGTVYSGAFQITLLLPIAVVLAFFLAWVFSHTKIGLLTIASGYQDSVAKLKAIGINALLVRTLATALGGACAGVSGAHLALFYPGGWSNNLATGVGIIALTIAFMVRAKPVLALIAAVLFAILAGLAIAIQISYGTNSYHILNAAPYIVALIVLVVIGKRKLENLR